MIQYIKKDKISWGSKIGSNSKSETETKKDAKGELKKERGKYL